MSYADTARRLVAQVWNAEHEAAAYELVAVGCPGLDGSGPDAVLAWHRDRRTSFSDLRYQLVEVVASETGAALRWRATGTQDGPFGPVPATGRPVAYAGATFLSFDADGRVADVWSVNELFQLLQQLGVTVTPPEQG
ncbi:ester cyclase [Catellatospora tritici]|uniref:ester cyclase n=1 Tax=Catellatospora tritici TaxID=2851566 RepID=UPI001C2CD2BA|nr:ester cyclase [Catellatospora tritici]MBV1848895.1 ester cyclase [Catellatospora tritici]